MCDDPDHTALDNPAVPFSDLQSAANAYHQKELEVQHLTALVQLLFNERSNTVASVAKFAHESVAEALEKQPDQTWADTRKLEVTVGPGVSGWLRNGTVRTLLAQPFNNYSGYWCETDKPATHTDPAPVVQSAASQTPGDQLNNRRGQHQKLQPQVPMAQLQPHQPHHHPHHVHTPPNAVPRSPANANNRPHHAFPAQHQVSPHNSAQAHGHSHHQQPVHMHAGYAQHETSPIQHHLHPVQPQQHQQQQQHQHQQQQQAYMGQMQNVNNYMGQQQQPTLTPVPHPSLTPVMHQSPPSQNPGQLQPVHQPQQGQQRTPLSAVAQPFAPATQRQFQQADKPAGKKGRNNSRGGTPTAQAKASAFSPAIPQVPGPLAKIPQQRINEMMDDDFGKLIYDDIAPHPQYKDFAGKITGMFLELPRQDLLRLLQDRQVFDNKLREAVQLLRQMG
eukprot:NODE_891_length_1574_cov_57.657913_g880_i0.p1 GENE.NODE_891_length_1574_cov_57.657913_g880_i0~~NODE_891_length_1574_cov_57.657913_g880_i0.p1  ORF type:complete len:447 (-),score=68.98 NODE_891_length_1574_cov_57.657913_g880_i0:136-1476(-)